MAKKVSGDTLKRYERLSQREKKSRHRAKISDFPGGRSEYVAFRQWQKRQAKNATRPPQPQATPLLQIAQPQAAPRHQAAAAPHPQSSPEEDLSELFPSWAMMGEKRKTLLTAMYRSAINCDQSGSNAQIAKIFARQVFPGMFSEKDTRGSFTPGEYADELSKMMSGDADAVMAAMLAGHIEQSGGQVDVEFVKNLIDAFGKKGDPDDTPSDS